MEKCAVCGVDAKQKCASCNVIFYCSREHQVIDWKRGHKKSCKCFEVINNFLFFVLFLISHFFQIESNDILGRYMIAKRDIKPGEIILREKPAIVGPKMLSFVSCLGCHKTLIPESNKDFYKCSKCSWPMCGKSCENSEFHIDECKIMAEKRFKSSITNRGVLKAESSYCVITPLRMILLKQKNPKL